MASGYAVGERLKLSSLEATCIVNQSGSSMLIVSSVPHGPSWPQIFKSLEDLDPPPKLVTFGKHPAVLVEYSNSVKLILESISKNASCERSRQVFLEDVGFISLDSKPRPSLRFFVLPASSLAIVLVFGSLWGFVQQPTDEVRPPAAPDSCIVDAPKPEFVRWLSSSLQSDSALIAGQEIATKSERGHLKVVVDEIIGSAARVSGSATCFDGRVLKINHRVDTSGSGDVLELGQ